MTEKENKLEELVLQEAIVSATGINAEMLQIGIKGDPSMRETALVRERYDSPLDKIYQQLEPVLKDLLLNRGIYQLFIGFNNAEIRTRSLFDPLREEIHAAEKLVNNDYVERHFPPIPYEEKIAAMREMYNQLYSSELYRKLPKHWQSIVRKRHDSWQPMEQEEVLTILSTLSSMRNMPEFYLRNATISVVQSVVRMQFNCDGTQIVRAKDFQQFIEDNMP
ncbi:MAG: hypothetical protein DSZ32_02335 [Gammaproteobacteria bacterium]|nr:MAG: hypothetical protein DSZ33_06630 [Gammaproteobacteria bacterium]RTZ61184.1 MAG: hypothetical protein DSZ32_02335 [Gammaproteobacteria bacterium]